jgi:hypothetical protein
VYFESLSFFLRHLLHDVLPCVQSLPVFESFIKVLYLFSSNLTEVGGDVLEELFGHGVIGGFFLVFDELDGGGVAVEDDYVGGGVDFVNDEVREEVLGDGGYLRAWSDVLFDADCELFGGVEEGYLVFGLLGFHGGGGIINFFMIGNYKI